MGVLVRETPGRTEADFAEILDAHQGAVRAYLGRFVRDWDAVDDLAQETFLAAYRSLASYTGEAPMRLWLLAIARNRALMHLRTENHRRSRETRNLRTALAGWLSRRIESDDSTPGVHDRKVSALEDCIHHLPERSACLVDEFYFKERTAGEIARQTGKKENAVWVTLLRIRRALRRCIQIRLSSAEAAR